MGENNKKEEILRRKICIIPAIKALIISIFFIIEIKGGYADFSEHIYYHHNIKFAINSFLLVYCEYIWIILSFILTTLLEWCFRKFFIYGEFMNFIVGLPITAIVFKDYLRYIRDNFGLPTLILFIIIILFLSIVPLSLYIILMKKNKIEIVKDSNDIKNDEKEEIFRKKICIILIIKAFLINFAILISNKHVDFWSSFVVLCIIVITILEWRYKKFFFYCEIINAFIGTLVSFYFLKLLIEDRMYFKISDGIMMIITIDIIIVLFIAPLISYLLKLITISEWRYKKFFFYCEIINAFISTLVVFNILKQLIENLISIETSVSSIIIVMINITIFSFIVPLILYSLITNKKELEKNSEE